MRARYQLPARDQITRVARAQALQSENATIGVRGSVYANDNRLISDAFSLEPYPARLFFLLFFLFRFLNACFSRNAHRTVAP